MLCCYSTINKVSDCVTIVMLLVSSSSSNDIECSQNTCYAATTVAPSQHTSSPSEERHDTSSYYEVIRSRNF